MLLRSLTKHVKEQNWFAVFIDFIIVVFGVFMGLQVANWNENRVEKIKEQEILVAILDDLDLDLKTLNNSSNMAKVSIDTANYIIEKAGFKATDKITLPVANFQLDEQELDILPAGVISEDQKNQLWKLVTVRYFPNQANTAFSSLIAAGDLKILKDQSLINNLQNYSQLWKSIKESNVTTHKKFRDRAVFVGQEYGLSPFSITPEKEFIGMIKAHPKLRAVVRTMLEYTVLHKSQIEATKKLTVSMISKIEKEINQSAIKKN